MTRRGLSLLEVMMSLALTGVGVAYFDLGPFNMVVMISIAVVKAVLVVLYFMHVRYGTHLTWVFAGAGFVWLAIMLVLTMQDYFTRGWLTS